MGDDASLARESALRFSLWSAQRPVWRVQQGCPMVHREGAASRNSSGWPEARYFRVETPGKAGISRQATDRSAPSSVTQSMALGSFCRIAANNFWNAAGALASRSPTSFPLLVVQSVTAEDLTPTRARRRPAQFPCLDQAAGPVTGSPNHLRSTARWNLLRAGPLGEQSLQALATPSRP